MRRGTNAQVTFESASDRSLAADYSELAATCGHLEASIPVELSLCADFRPQGKKSGRLTCERRLLQTRTEEKTDQARKNAKERVGDYVAEHVHVFAQRSR